jgi:uncharacterized protein (DUF4415 family)
MAIALDGFKVLKRLGDTPETFGSIRVDVDKAARALVVKCLKTKATDLGTTRAIHAALHDKPFELLIDGLKQAELKSLLTKLDKHHPDLKTMSPPEQRAHLLALARGDADATKPAAKKAKAAKSPRAIKAKKEAPQRLQSAVMDLFRARGENPDED